MNRRSLLASIAAAPLIAGHARAAGSFVETRDGQQLFCRDIGAGKPVVFVHGWTLSSAIWRGQLDWLAGQGLRAVAYDRRGHGQSTKPASGYGYDTLADDLASVLDRLGLRDVTLVGHSMGGGEVVRYLACHGGRRVARVLLVAPTTPYALKTADNPEGLDKAIYDKLVAALETNRPAYLQAGMPAFLGAPPDPATAAWALAIATQATLDAQVQCLRAFTETDFRPDLKAVTVPTRIVYGTADAPIIPVHARRTHEGIAGSRLETYEGAPHALFVTDRDRFNNELLEFAQS
ncbi:MAG: alpha/beta hydrolase [Enhydrobacter sp.]